MHKFDLVQPDKHSTNDLLSPTNLRFSSHTNLVKTLYYIKKVPTT
ncbi:hypothetical protein SAMN04488006_0554 [Lutibacter maritimus]|uniref:Uncharacterized protein n=1 Tax=Lutibacter maritimus TaxID=593133 RepID=A0A1I6NTU4_9FLAO|nr:hypothetical protein SAMN04488006_0554 [Lutibacter maritimus]